MVREKNGASRLLVGGIKAVVYTSDTRVGEAVGVEFVGPLFKGRGVGHTRDCHDDGEEPLDDELHGRRLIITSTS